MRFCFPFFLQFFLCFSVTRRCDRDCARTPWPWSTFEATPKGNHCPPPGRKRCLRSASDRVRKISLLSAPSFRVGCIEYQPKLWNSDCNAPNQHHHWPNFKIERTENPFYLVKRCQRRIVGRSGEWELSFHLHHPGSYPFQSMSEAHFTTQESLLGCDWWSPLRFELGINFSPHISSLQGNYRPFPERGSFVLDSHCASFFHQDHSSTPHTQEGLRPCQRKSHSIQH